MSGYVLMHRDIIGNPQFRGKDDEYAAMWLVLDAAWEDCTRRVGRISVDLLRGQTAHAVEFFAQAWGCSKSTAHARLKHFEKVSFIRTESRTGYTLVTLCNYAKYQDPSAAARTLDRTEPERCPNGLKERKEGKEIGGRVGGAHSADAQAIVSRFEALRVELWPTEVKFPAPRLTLLTEAQSYLDAGAPLALVIEVMERGMRSAAGKNLPATHSLRAFHRSMAAATANHLSPPTVAGFNQRGTDSRNRSCSAALDRLEADLAGDRT